MIPRQDIQHRLDESIAEFERRINGLSTLNKVEVVVYEVRTKYCKANVRVWDGNKVLYDWKAVEYLYSDLGISII